MKKKYAFFASVALAVLLSHSCRMPEAVEIRTGNIEFNLPLGFRELDIASLIRNNLSEELGDVRIFDMVGHEDAQTFMVAIELDVLPSFNPSDYLDNIGDMGDAGFDPIEANIVVPKIAWDTVRVEEYFQMDGLFYTMENSLNDDSMPRFLITSPEIPLVPGIPVPPILSLPSEMTEGINFFAFRDGNPANANFQSVLISGVSDGFINTMELVLESRYPLPSGLSIMLTDIRIEGGTSGRPIGSPDFQNIVLDESNQSRSAWINISGETIGINDPPRFSVGEIVVEYTGSVSSSFTPHITAELRLNQISLRGARGLRIGTLEHPMPEDIVEDKEMDVPTGFLNAEIGRGTFAITVEPLPYRPGETFAEGFHIDVELAVSQVVGGDDLDGLVGPWIFNTDSPLDFALRPIEQRTINRNDIVISPDESILRVRASPNGISFELYGEHYDNKTLPVTITMEMNIQSLDLIRWELDDELIPLPEIELDFKDMDGTDVTEFIERITFDQIEVVLTITDLDHALDGSIALAVTSSLLGFDGEPTPPLGKGENLISSTASEATPHTLDLVAHPIVPVNVELVPVINGMPVPDGRFLEIGPLDIDGHEETKLNLSAEISLNFNWTRAFVNLDRLLGDEYNLSGGVPDEPINIRAMLGDIMYGFSFAKGSIDMRLFMDGPVDVVNEIKPTLILSAYTGEEDEAVKIFSGDVQIDGGFPLLPDDTGVWRDPVLPTGGLQDINVEEFVAMFARMPEALSFTYEVELGEAGNIYVTPGMFEDVESGEIRALIILKLALALQADAGATFNLPLFDDQDDLFGRSQLGDQLLGIDLDINALSFRMDFDDSIFRGARLLVDGGYDDPSILDGDILFGREGLALNDGGGYVEVRITNDHWGLIERRLIPPDIRIVYPNETTVRIPRNPLPTRIGISVDGSYTMTFGN